jgi:uncharacterized membrane protein YbhN (UPF0104 family)
LIFCGDLLSIVKKTALYFARKEFCRKAIEEHADLSIFKKKPSLRIIIGLVLIAFSYVIGLPAAIILSIIAASRGNAMMAAVAAPLLYGISWLVFMIGIYLAGPEYGKALSRWTARVILEKILGDEAKTNSSSKYG